MNLFDIPAVSLALSLMVCWALFAIVCSLVHESVVRIKAERGRFLKKHILAQLNDVVNHINFGLCVYQQGSVTLLSPDPKRPSEDIDATVFAHALVDAVSGLQGVNEQLTALQQKTQTGGLENNVLVYRSLNNIALK